VEENKEPELSKAEKEVQIIMEQVWKGHIDIVYNL
jgi:hypothetical protein